MQTVVEVIWAVCGQEQKPQVIAAGVRAEHLLDAYARFRRDA